MEKSNSAKIRDYINSKPVTYDFIASDIAKHIGCKTRAVSVYMALIKNDGYVVGRKGQKAEGRRGLYFIYNRVKVIPAFNLQKKRNLGVNVKSIDFNSPWYRWCYAIN